MLETEQVKQIAVYMGTAYFIRDDKVMALKVDDTFAELDPLNNGYNHEVLKHMSKVDDYSIDISDGELAIFKHTYDPKTHTNGKEQVCRYEFTNESICLAYIAVMESK